jgi:hypothetical protein
MFLYHVAQWRREHLGEDIPDGHVFVQPWPAGPSSQRRDQMIYYQFRADRARRTLRGIDEQVAKAAEAVAGLAPVKRNRFIALDGATKSVNRELGAKARDLAGLKGYVTNLAACPDGTPVTADFVIGSYHELWNIEKSFRMSKSDLQARPVYHRKRDSIEAHLTIVFAALAVSRWIEAQTSWSIRKFVKTARRYRTIQIQAGRQTITAADPPVRRPPAGPRSHHPRPAEDALIVLSQVPASPGQPRGDTARARATARPPPGPLPSGSALGRPAQHGRAGHAGRNLMIMVVWLDAASLMYRGPRQARLLAGPSQ